MQRVPLHCWHPSLTVPPCLSLSLSSACSFDELARLCDPSGKMVKTDRVSIVQDAIRVLQELRLQNNQLRQLNKFLEVGGRVGTPAGRCWLGCVLVGAG